MNLLIWLRNPAQVEERLDRLIQEIRKVQELHMQGDVAADVLIVEKFYRYLVFYFCPSSISNGIFRSLMGISFVISRKGGCNIQWAFPSL